MKIVIKVTVPDWTVLDDWLDDFDKELEAIEAHDNTYLIEIDTENESD
jgi:hypothetical protein